MFGITSEKLFDFFVRAMMLLIAMPVHECAHGLVAYRLGDRTPAEQGRLTLNPFAHLDWIGSLMLFFTGFGWGKPVEVDMRNFKNPRRDMALSALAGPVSNLVMAFVFLAVCKVVFGFWPRTGSRVAAAAIYIFLNSAVLINVSLAVFNILPVPPLDGSKIFGALLPKKLYWGMLRYQRQISLIMVVLLFTGILTGPLMWISTRVLYILDSLTLPFGALLYR